MSKNGRRFPFLKSKSGSLKILQEEIKNIQEMFYYSSKE